MSSFRPIDFHSFSWTHQGYLISTDPKLLQIDAINDAFDSDILYWTTRQPVEVMKQLLEKSWCLGIYQQTPKVPSVSGPSDIRQVGLARFITDETTFGYLTDLYLLHEHRSHGLATFALQRADEVFQSIPTMRRLLLVAHTDNIGYYNKVFGEMMEFEYNSAPTCVLSRPYLLKE